MGDLETVSKIAKKTNLCDDKRCVGGVALVPSSAFSMVFDNFTNFRIKHDESE